MKEVSTVAVKKDGLLLMGKRRDNGRWTCPGGHLETGESPLSGAVRELLEETGIEARASDLKPISSRTVKPGLRVHGFLYEPKGEVQTSMKEDPDQEVRRWHFVDPEKLKDSELHVPRKDNVLLSAMEKNAMNYFWLGFEKRASEEKLAWDADHNTDTHYGYGANRCMHGSGYVHDALLKAAKDPHLEVSVLGPGLHFDNKDPAKFEAGMSQMREILGPRPKKLNRDRMDWHRSYAWFIAARKDNPKFKPTPGKKDKYGDPETVQGKIYDHISRFDL